MYMCLSEYTVSAGKTECEGWRVVTNGTSVYASSNPAQQTTHTKEKSSSYCSEEGKTNKRQNKEYLLLHLFVVFPRLTYIASFSFCGVQNGGARANWRTHPTQLREPQRPIQTESYERSVRLVAQDFGRIIIQHNIDEKFSPPPPSPP